VYDPTLTQGKIDYNKQTVDLSFKLGLIINFASFRVLTELLNGLKETGKMNDWGREFRTWPGSDSAIAFYNINITAILLNSDGKQIATSQERLRDSNGIGLSFTNEGLIRYESEMKNRTGQTQIISKTANVLFSSVNANDITDTLTIQITSVNGVNIQGPDNQGYIRIRTGSLLREKSGPFVIWWTQR